MKTILATFFAAIAISSFAQVLPPATTPWSRGLLRETNGTDAFNYMVGTNGYNPANPLLIPSTPTFAMVPFDTIAGANALYLYTSVDGYNFSPIGTDPILKANPQTAWARDARIIKWNGVWYMSYLVGNNTTIPIASSTNWANWTFVTNVTCVASGKSVVWPNHWFVDPNDGVLHMMTFQQGTTDSLWTPVEQHVTITNNSVTWSTPVLLTSSIGNNNWTNIWTNSIDHEFTYWNGYYYDFFKQEGTSPNAYIGLARSTNLTSNWELCPTNGVSGYSCTNNWAGWGVGYEGQSLVRLPNGYFRLYFEQFSGFALWASDCAPENFPLGPWSAKKQIYTGNKVISDPAFVLLTNAVDIGIVNDAKAGLNFALTPLSEAHAPYYDWVIGPNVSSFGSTNAALSGWQGNELIFTNRASLSMNFFTGTANNPEIDFIYLAKGGLAGGQSWQNLFNFQIDGYHGPIVATTATANSLTTSNAIFYNRLTAPTPASLGANGGQLWKSNTVLYYSYTADGSTSNNAVKIAP